MTDFMFSMKRDHLTGYFRWLLFFNLKKMMKFQIKFTQERDAGIYECQVSTPTGTISRRVTLNEIFPEAFIRGGEEYHVDEGSPIALTCGIDKISGYTTYFLFVLFLLVTKALSVTAIALTMSKIYFLSVPLSINHLHCFKF